MSAGLFSIFDLSDQFFASRQSLFSQAQWKFINDYFDEKLKLPMYTLETVTKDTIATVENTLNLSGNYDAVIDYIRKIRDKNKN
ncbi:uncharacterized protein B0P05DRAFT_448695, partial [Gilbertella persicaria]|uniref:uncharacterized protein n=1 Tax=Gilbertella persicaria TaxID=101096 RepID=UPI00221F1942